MRRVRGAVWVCLGLVAALLPIGVFSESDAATVLPAAIATPTGNQARIVVKVGGDRTGAQTVSGLAGVTLGLYESAASTTPLFTCTTSDDTPVSATNPIEYDECAFIVPNAQVNGSGNCGTGSGVNCDRRFYVKQIGVPSGWRINATLRTGSNDGTQSQATPYQFQTGTRLRAGTTYTSTVDFMVGSGTTNRVASGGIWQQSRDNPLMPTKCGLNVAFIADLSSSVALSGTLGQLKAATDTFIDALVGTPSKVALFSFSTVSPAIQGAPNYPDLHPVSTVAQANVVKSRYLGWQANGSTNWDQGMFQPSLSGAAGLNDVNHYDLAVVLTDGNPTSYSNPTDGAQTYNRLREIENGIFAANALKAKNTRVIAVGVGSGVTQPQTALNLAAISGTTAFNGSNVAQADYFQTADYASAGEALRSLVFKGCTPSLTIVKAIVPNGGGIADAVPASDAWSMTASTAAGNLTINGGASATLPTAADGTGAVNFPLVFSSPGTATISVHEAEKASDGYTIVQPGGDNAVCTLKSAAFPLGTSVTIANDNADLTNSPGFSFDMPVDSAVSCIIYNRAPASITPADLTVTKKWIINGQTVAQGAQPPAIGAALWMTGPASATATGQGWGVARLGYNLTTQNTASLGEAMYFGDLELCNLDSAVVTAASGVSGVTPGSTAFPVGDEAVPGALLPVTLTAAHGTLEVTNAVTCESALTLVKTVEGGNADPDSWTLSAISPGGGALAGPSGTSGVSGLVTPGVPYQLAESGGDPNYVQVDERTDLASTPDDESPVVQARATYPSSTGSMYCAIVDANGVPISSTYDGLNGAVTVPIGQRVRCEAVNQTATLTLLKVVHNEYGGTAVPSDWRLTAAPTGDGLPAGLGSKTVTGSDVRNPSLTAAGTNTFNVRPGVPYELTEAGPGAAQNYEPEGYDCEEVRETRSTTVTFDPLSSWVCTFTNHQTPSPWTAHKVSDPASGRTIKRGEVVTYTITARREAGGAGAPDNLVLTDDLSDVLDDAALVAHSIVTSEGTAKIEGTTLTWTMESLKSSAELTYKVRVHADAEADSSLHNVLHAPGSENCESTGAACATANRVLGESVEDPGDLAETGSSARTLPLLGAGGAALAVGTALAFAARRRRMRRS